MARQTTPAKVSDLKPAPYNPRCITSEAQKALDKCMQEFGDIAGITFNLRTRHLITGHQRSNQLPRGAKLVRTDRRTDVVGTVGYGYAEAHGTRWPVRFVDWPETREKSANVAANSPLLSGQFTSGLAQVLADIQADSPVLFEELLMTELEIPPDVADLKAGETDPDSVPEPPDKAITAAGDLWILGGHRLLCGDSGSAADLDKLMDGQPCHLVNTDPPYNVKVEPRSNNAIAAGLSSFESNASAKRQHLFKTMRDPEHGRRTSGLTHHQGFDLARGKSKAHATTQKMRPKDRPLENDFVSDEKFDKLLRAWFGNIARVLQPGRAFYIWGGYANCGNYPPVLKACELYFSQAIIWVKEHPVLTRKDFMGNHEWCFYGWREGAGHKFYGPNNAVDVWPIKKVSPQSMVHLTEKPVELATRAIQYSSRAGENVLDMFGGSGSTLIGCEQAGRCAFLMEIDPLYCDVIVTRWEQFAGKKAERKKA